MSGWPGFRGGRWHTHHHRRRRRRRAGGGAGTFRIIAAEEPERVILVEASGWPDEVTKRLLDAIADLLP